MVYTEAHWNPVEMLDLRRFKEAIVSYGMHLPFKKWMLNLRATRNRILPQDWKDLFTAVLEAGLHLQWRTC